MFKGAGISFLCETSFYNIQRNVVSPGLEKLWQKHVELNLPKMPKEAVLCGDGRCDSPGHSAKLLVYPIMDNVSSRIYHLELADKRQASL